MESTTKFSYESRDESTMDITISRDGVELTTSLQLTDIKDILVNMVENTTSKTDYRVIIEVINVLNEVRGINYMKLEVDDELGQYLEEEMNPRLDLNMDIFVDCKEVV